jgi:hypothetical protein
LKLSLELVGRHNTGFTFTFTCPWASVSDLSLYPHTLRQPPDFVYTALLPGIPQIEIDLAIAINTARLQPELPDMPLQLQSAYYSCADGVFTAKQKK